MGIFIHLGISKSVKQHEWEKVYEETLQLVGEFPLAERRKVMCKGIDTICLVPTKERVETYGWNNEKKRRGWFADGDYITMNTAEEYSLYRELVQDNEVEADAGDALFEILPVYMDYDWNDPRFWHIYDIWGAKTQGEPYHIYLLAIACLIEARLGEKAIVYGDITRGQCKKAVELANKYLKKPIDIPDRCDMERLRKRISVFPLSEQEQCKVFERFYLGTKDAEFGDYIRSVYSEKIWEEYWRDSFEHSRIGTIGFNSKINEYFLWGFDLENLCRVVNYNDKDNTPQYEKFIKRILDAKLHLKVKDCEDILEIDQEESEPYGIATLMTQFAYAGARNKKVDRYIPIEKIQQVLSEQLGAKCDVDLIIEEYLAQEKEKSGIKLSKDMTEKELKLVCEQDDSEIFKQIIDIKRQDMIEEYEKYDITTHEDLIYYEKGDKMTPEMEEALRQSFVFYNSLNNEERYKQLMEGTANLRCIWLVEQNRSILIRDIDWNKIFTDIKKHKEAFARYYPMVRVIADSDNLRCMIKAIVLNDELYEYCKVCLQGEE